MYFIVITLIIMYNCIIIKKGGICMDARTTVINNATLSLQPMLTDEQLQVLRDALFLELNNYEIQERTTALTLVDNTPDLILKKFLATKSIEGKAESTLKRYRDICYHMIHTINKPITEVETYDLRYYLALYKDQRKVSNRTLDGMRRCIKSFFSWLTAEDIIPKNPALALAQIKYDKTVKKPYSDSDMERLKRSCQHVRDRALVEFLYSSGCRVSEIVNLDRTDINFLSSDAIVFGKGGKERIVYITEVAMLYLKEYLETRTDNNPCLFASLRTPYKRLSKNGIEARLRELGKIAGVENVHPHRYRRTLATNLLDRGANIQDVASILGHEDIKTTQIYCYISQENVKSSHKKYAA